MSRTRLGPCPQGTSMESCVVEVDDSDMCYQGGLHGRVNRSRGSKCGALCIQRIFFELPLCASPCAAGDIVAPLGRGPCCHRVAIARSHGGSDGISPNLKSHKEPRGRAGADSGLSLCSWRRRSRYTKWRLETMARPSWRCWWAARLEGPGSKTTR